jgi:hypothetical protein
MTIDEAREAIDQMGVDIEVQAESSRSGGLGGTAQPREGRCGICGKAGHNRRTCQIVIEVSREEESNYI